ncbi:MAG: transcription-repair coupling factor, partial [Methylotenera sp.]|nr:transcription-repair coupling factor [Methylotenera sp.]
MTQTTLPIPSLGLASRITLATSGEDALSLANLALKLKASKPSQPLVIISANAFDAQRLLEEIPYFAPSLSVHLLPDWETLPYDQFSPHPDLISERLTTLYHIAQNACDVVIVPLATALIRLSPKAYLNANTFMLKKGQKLDLEALRRQCAEAGYHHVTQVISHGEFSVRGGLVDLFPMGSALPYRLDLFDDEIETIRTFDVDTQRSLYPVPEIRLLPAREFPLDETGIALFRSQFREAFEGDPQRAKIYKDVSKGVASGGIEWYLPLFFEQTATLLDYLPANSLLCLHG